MFPIDSWDDRIDSRDVLTRIDELTKERESYMEDHADGWWPGEYPDEAKELRSLVKLVSELRQEAMSGDTPEDGIFLVRESDFEDYAEELWEETTDSSDRELATKWPYTHIDWEAAANDLRQDYTSIEFDGVTYYYR